ncbi:MAG: DUF4350 domain-containing protein, partial [Actinobacteria bacterium]|nr:DUF4350 domain-containing protein [Actinomycetota bacterium]
MVGPVDAILEAGKTNRGRRAVNAVGGRWRGLPPWARTAVTLGAALVAIEVGLAAINFATGGAGPSGPASSAYATSPEGLAAYAELLSSRGGHAVVRERRALADAGLDPTDTVVLLDPGRVAESDTSALLAFVESGGRLIAGGRDPAWLDRIIDGAPDWAPPGVDRATPVAPAPETGGVAEVVSAGAGSWSEDNGALAILGGEDGTLVSVAAVGEGRIVLLPDASPLQNRLLGNADNAAFGLAAAGARGRTVLFGEEAHGFEEATGLAALPAAWRVSL